MGEQRWAVVQRHDGVETVYGPFDSPQEADAWRDGRRDWKGDLATVPLLRPADYE